MLSKFLSLHFYKLENQFSLFLWNLEKRMSLGHMRCGMKLGENLPYFQDFTMKSANYLLQKSLGACLKTQVRGFETNKALENENL